MGVWAFEERKKEKQATKNAALLLHVKSKWTLSHTHIYEYTKE